MKRVMLVTVLVAAVVVLAVVIGWQPDGRKPAGPTTGLEVVIVGVDAMDWFVLRTLLTDAQMPATTSLLSRGLSGEMAADRPPVPEVGWTSLGRGRGLSEEELSTVRGVDGRLYGLTPQLARLVDAAGGKTLTVGWPASWPADDEAGLVVAPYRPASAVHETGLPAAILPGDAHACPPAIRERVDELVGRNEEVWQDEFSRLIYDGPEPVGGWREHIDAARWAFLADLTAIDVAASMMADQSPDLMMVCLGGLDVVSHRFLAPAMPSFFNDPPEEYEAYADVLDNYYRFVDSGIERLRRLTDENTIFIVCSTYGIHPSLDVPGATGSHVNGPPGVLILRGARIVQRQKALSLATVDVAPTVLALLGVPIPTDMDGRVVQEALPPGLLQAHPLSYSGTTKGTDGGRSDADLSTADALVRARLEMVSVQ